MKLLVLLAVITGVGVGYIVEFSQSVNLSQQNDLMACTRAKKGQPSDDKGENPSRT